MMGSAVPIIEVLSEGQFLLNEDDLSSIGSMATECQNFALISIMGTNKAENAFVLNCLTNYLDSQRKDVWPEECHTLNNSWFRPNPGNRPSVRLWSKPFIIEVEEQRTAVFLMDSTHDFGEEDTKLTEDIIGLFCGTSSTVIYLKVGQLVVSFI